MASNYLLKLHELVPKLNLLSIIIQLIRYWINILIGITCLTNCCVGIYSLISFMVYEQPVGWMTSLVFVANYEMFPHDDSKLRY